MLLLEEARRRTRRLLRSRPFILLVGIPKASPAEMDVFALGLAMEFPLGWYDIWLLLPEQ